MWYTPIIAGASNRKGGTNPAFSLTDFQAQYPQFFTSGEDGEEGEPQPLIPTVLMESYLAMAHGSIKKSRYHEAWEMCMGLFIAHFATLYLQSAIDPAGGAAAAIAAGQAKGLVSAESVDGVSVSYDFSQTMADLDGWAGWKLTNYGVQLATLAKQYGLGGMYIP